MRASDQSRELMFSLVRRWQTSGISQKAFCKEHDIRYHVFHYWYGRFRTDTTEGTSSPGRFIHFQATRETGEILAEVNF